MFWKIYESKNIYLSNFLSNFKLFCYSSFPFLYIQGDFLKNLWKQKVLSLSDILSNFKLFCGSYSAFSYISTKSYWRIYENKSIMLKQFLSNFKLFCYSNFLFLYIHENILKNLWKQNVLCLNDFLRISNDFATRISHSYIFTKFNWKIYENKNIVFKTISNLFCHLRSNF